MLDTKNFEGVEDYYLAADTAYVDYLKDDNLEEILNIMSDYKDYSPRNAMLIHLQDENAGNVMSVPKWRENGRKVKIASEPIVIFTKIYDSFTNKGEKRPEGGNLYFNDSGIFRKINTYREKDTFGSGCVKKYTMKDVENNYEAVKDSFSRIFEGYDVFYVDELSKETRGTAILDRNTKEIEIKKGMDVVTEFKTLIDVGSLVLLKMIQSSQISMLKKYRPNEVSNFIKECSEYIVDRRFGIEVPNIKRVEEQKLTTNYYREEFMTMVIARQIANKITKRIEKAIDYSREIKIRAEEEKKRKEERDAARAQFFDEKDKESKDQNAQNNEEQKSECIDKVPIDNRKTIDLVENNDNLDKNDENVKE